MGRLSGAELADRAEIVDVLQRYTTGINAMDARLIASCFAVDGQIELIHDEVVTGRDALVELFADATGIRSRETGLDRVDRFTHLLSNLVVELDGDRATVESLVTSHIIGSRDGETVMLVRSVRYSDVMARIDGVWAIARRQLRLQWGYETRPTVLGTS
jgi:hypothetical protein